jgi:tetratricopeptide (TPR) repeat protein
MRPFSLSLLAAAALLGACTPATPRTPASAPEPVEARSLMGEPLHRPVLAPETRARLERDLNAARADHARDPDDADATIWLGRRLAYLGRYRQAIDVFSDGIARHPGDARMYRHRGHRWITLRELDRAAADLEHALDLVRGTPDEIEPDGAPNRYAIPTSTLHTNVGYHLGLARFLQGRFEEAADAYHWTLRAALAWEPDDPAHRSDDMHVATADWLYMALRRLGRDEEAAAVLEPVHAGMRILENDAYHRRLLMYRGEVQPGTLLDQDGGDPLQMATQGFGVGHWYLINGSAARAEEIFRQIVGYGNWPAFGHIAAEAELARGFGGGR